MTFSIIAATGPHIKTGKLRSLGLTGTRRSELLPDLPTVAEAGVPGFQVHNTYGYLAPAGTPLVIVRALAAVISQGMNTPETVKALAADGSAVVAPATPEEFRSQVQPRVCGAGAIDPDDQHQTRLTGCSSPVPAAP